MWPQFCGLVVMDRRKSGTTAELAVAAKLSSLGHEISWPLAASSFDLIATKGKVSRRVQVKSAIKSKRSTYRVWLRYGAKGEHRYTAEECNSIIVYLPYHEDYTEIKEAGFYVIPITVASKYGSCIMYPPGHGKHPHWVSRWEKYRDGWRYL